MLRERERTCLTKAHTIPLSNTQYDQAQQALLVWVQTDIKHSSSSYTYHTFINRYVISMLSQLLNNNS